MANKTTNKTESATINTETNEAATVTTNTETNETTNAAANKTAGKSRKYYGSTLEWRDYEFFLCDAEKSEKTLEMLKEREFLLPSGLPNQEKITENAKFFAKQLAERIAKSDRAKHFGLAQIAEYAERLSRIQEQTAFYFYMAYLYGSVFWRVPFNVQRLTASPDALSIYLEIFGKEFTETMNGLCETEVPRIEESD